MPSRPRNVIERTRGPALDPGPSGARGVDVIRSGAIPRLDVNAALAPAQGMAKIGEAISGVGNSFSKLAEETQKNDDLTNEYKANTILTAADIEIKAKMEKEPNKDKWGEISTDVLSDAQAKIDQLKFSPEAKEMVGLKIERNVLQTKGNVTIAIARKSASDANEALLGTLKSQVLSNNLPQVKAITSAAVESGRMLPETKAAYDLQAEHQIRDNIEKQQKQAEISNVLALSRENPTDALAFAKNPETRFQDEQTRAQAINIAQAAERGQTATASDQLREMVSAASNNGLAVTPDQIKEWQKAHPGTSEREVAIAIQHSRNANDANRKATIAANADALSSQMFTNIDNFDRTKNTKEDYIKLMGEIDELPESGVRTDLRAALRGKFTGKAEKMGQPLVQQAEKTLNSMLRDGKLGGYKQWVDKKYLNDEKDPSKGDFRKFDPNAPVSADGQRYEGKWTVDEKAYQQALTRKTALAAKVSEYLKKKPNATPDDVTKAIYELSDAPTRVGVWESLSGESNGLVSGMLKKFEGFTMDVQLGRTRSLFSTVPPNEPSQQESISPVEDGEPGELEGEAGDILNPSSRSENFRKPNLPEEASGPDSDYSLFPGMSDGGEPDNILLSP